MTKKVFRPLWQYDVPATEAWLRAMAAAGFQLVNLCCLRQAFVFCEAEPEDRTFRIDFKPGTALPQTLVEAGWVSALRVGNWDFLTNKEADVKLFPPREAVINQTRASSHRSLFFLVIAALYTLVSLAVGGALLLSGQVERVPAPYPILDLVPVAGLALTLSLLAWAITAYARSRRTLKEFSAARGYSVDLGLVSGANQLVKVPDNLQHLHRVTKLFWQFDHARTEKWLGEMAEKGFILKFIKGKRFYFAKGNPARIKYFVDSQGQLTPDYFDILSETGFTLHFDGQLDFGRFMVWSKEYVPGEDAPELYTDREEFIAGLKRMLVATAKSALFWVALGSLQLYVGFSSIFVSQVHQTIWIVISSLWLLIIGYRLVSLGLALKAYRMARQSVV